MLVGKEYKLSRRNRNISDLNWSIKDSERICGIQYCDIKSRKFTLHSTIVNLLMNYLENCNLSTH